MKMNRRIVNHEMTKNNNRQESDSMAAFEAMMYIPVSLAQLELALRGKDVGLGTDGRGSTEENAEAKIVSQVA
jgi:hypothetical protein